MKSTETTYIILDFTETVKRFLLPFIVDYDIINQYKTESPPYGGGKSSIYVHVLV